MQRGSRHGLRRESGFSLIELLITVAIIGIIAAIALPSYQDSVRKGRRADAQSLLLDLAQRQQQFFIERRRYAVDAAALGVTIPDSVDKHYKVTFEVNAGNPPNFVITAEPTSTVQLKDGLISINRAGEKLPADKW